MTLTRNPFICHECGEDTGNHAPAPRGHSHTCSRRGGHLTLLTQMGPRYPSVVAQCKDRHGFWEGERRFDLPYAREYAEAVLDLELHNRQVHSLWRPVLRASGRGDDTQMATAPGSTLVRPPVPTGEATRAFSGHGASPRYIIDSSTPLLVNTEGSRLRPSGGATARNQAHDLRALFGVRALAVAGVVYVAREDWELLKRLAYGKRLSPVAYGFYLGGNLNTVTAPAWTLEAEQVEWARWWARAPRWVRRLRRRLP